MKANRRTIARIGRDDSAVSPVIAVILMVAITVVLAATVYVWVSGFAADGDQAPSASFKVVNCDDSLEDVTVKLLSGGPLQKDDLKVMVYKTSDASNAATAANSGTGTWSTGSTIVYGNGVAWDASPTAALDPDTEYSVDFIHTPTQQIIASVKFVC